MLTCDMRYEIKLSLQSNSVYCLLRENKPETLSLYSGEWSLLIACCIARLVSLCGIQSIYSSPLFGIDIELVVQLGLCPCVAYRAFIPPHYLGSIKSLLYSQDCVPEWSIGSSPSFGINIDNLIARLVSLCGIQSIVLVAAY